MSETVSPDPEQDFSQLVESAEKVKITDNDKNKTQPEPRFWFEFDNSEKESPLLCNSFSTLISTLEVCSNWQNDQLSDPKAVKPNSTKSLVSEHCNNIIRTILKQYKVNFITERELASQAMPMVGDKTVELSATWRLTLILLDIVGQLRLAIEKEEKNQPETEKEIEVLSLGAKLNLAKIIELITGFGIIQNLSDDINLPPMSSYSREFIERLSEKVKLTPLARFYRLAYILDVLCFIMKCPLIEGRLQRVNQQILAATLQLIDGPIPSPPPNSNKTDESKKRKTVKDMKVNIRVTVENEYFEFIQRLKVGLNECIQVYVFHYCYDPEVSCKYNENLFTVRAKAKFIASLLIFGALPNPKWMKECASQHCTTILIYDTFGLHIYFVALGENLKQSRVTVTSNEAFWKVSSTIGNFLSCVMIQLKDPQKRKEFICFMADQALGMITSYSQLSIHAAMKNPNTNESTFAGAVAETNDKTFFAFGIFTAFYLTRFNSQIVMDRLWIVLYKDWLQLPISLKHVMDLLEITEQFLTCRRLPSRATPSMRVSNGHIVFLIQVWRIHFFTFVATRTYLEGPVQSITVSKQLKVLDEKLGRLLIELFESIYSSTNLRVCDLLGNLTYNLDEDNKPSTLSLHWIEKSLDDDSSEPEIQLEVKPTEELLGTDKNKEMYRIIEDGVKVIAKLLTTRPVLSDLLPTIFEELLEEDVRCENDVCRIDPLADLDPSKIMEVFDLQQNKDCTRLTTVLLLSSFENNIEPIMDNLDADNGKRALNYLMLILRKVVLQIEESASRGVGFVFKDTLISLLRTTESVMDLMYASQAFESSVASLTPTTPSMSWDGFAPLIPYLHRLKECNHPDLKDKHIQEAIDNLHIRILTHCKGLDCKSKENPVDSDKNLPYYVGIQESNDTRPYVQANGLLNLRRLLESKDELALRNKNVIFGVFQSALEQRDSYVYLQAIRGISLMGSKWSSDCLPKLIADYKKALFNVVDIQAGPDSSRFIVVTKLGEAITKILKELGPMAIKHRDYVFDATICLMRDSDPLLRMSGVSTLAELCEILEIPFQSLVNHVWVIIEGLALDRDVQVRRAVFYLGTKSLRGISNLIERDGPSILFTTENYAVFLRNASQKFKLWASIERDEQCRLHLQLAHDELDRIFSSIITIPEAKLEKKITIYGS